MVLFITGCTGGRQAIPENTYHDYAGFRAYLQKCFEQEYIDPQLLSETDQAIVQLINQWSFDLDRMLMLMENRYHQINMVNSEICRNVQVSAHQSIQLARQHREHVRQNREDWNNTMDRVDRNKPVFCSPVGNSIMCY